MRVQIPILADLRLRRNARRGQAGFTLIELMLACFILAIGMAAGLVMIVVAIQSNTRNKLDTTATAVAQTVMEQLNSVATTSSTTQLTITDCASTAHTVNLDGSTGNTGAPLLTSTGGIDFTQAQVTNYSMYYATCGGATYDVRWHVETVDLRSLGTTATKHVKLLVVAARYLGATLDANGATQNLKLFAYPVNLRTYTGP